MPHELRYYQEESIKAVFDYWKSGEKGNPLIDLATGTGKSLVIAELLKLLNDQYGAMRIIVLMPTKELVQQNFMEIKRQWPSSDVGIYCAGLNKKSCTNRIIFGTIQSISKRPKIFGERDLIVVDEAHMVPSDGDGQYLSFISAMIKYNEKLRVLGYTATPYRTDSGRLDEGSPRVFDRVIYSYGLADGVRDGYLSPLISKQGAQDALIDLSKLKKRAGEFTGASMDEASQQVVSETVEDICLRAANRKSWIVFCTGVDHAKAVRDEFRSRGVSCETVLGETNSVERARIIKAFKDGAIQCLTGANVLLTGFNAPAVDSVAMARPTLSPGLFVQAVGRGTRLSEGKENCLVLDYGGNIERFGPVDLIGKIKEDGNKQGQYEPLVCPECDAYLPRSKYQCPDPCGHIFPENGLECISCATVNDPKAKNCQRCGEKLKDAIQKTCLECMCSNPPQNTECLNCFAPFPETEKNLHDTKADTEGAIMEAEVEAEWIKTYGWGCVDHEKKGNPNAPHTMRVEYETGIGHHQSEWLCFDHGLGSFAKLKAESWWRSRGGSNPEPESVAEAISRFSELSRPSELKVIKSEGFYQILDYGSPVVDGFPGDSPSQPTNALSDTDWLSDEVPF